MCYIDQELEIYLDDLESDHVERKETFQGDTPTRAREAVCAFANDINNHNTPGILFIGAKDDGTPSGCTIDDSLLRALADMKTDGNILPLPVLSVAKRILKGSEMAVVFVQPSDMPPVKYRGRIWIRTGPRRSIANAQEERILIEKRRYKDIPFDIHPVNAARMSDLSRVIFEHEYLPAAFASDVLASNARTYEERLASCKMIVSPEENIPTVLGLLAIGIRTQDFLPCAQIQFLRIDGIHLTDPIIDEELLSGTLVDMLRRAEEKLRAHNFVSIDVTSAPTHRSKFRYPPVAIQQILYNAVLHRTYEGTNAPVRIYWYNDRLEINSPGGPYGNVTQDNFGQPGMTDYRNRNIADLLKTFGFVQTFGLGIQLAELEMKKNGNPPLEFEVNQSAVVCVLRSES
jgi:ATP-dependent DNA helicase RecG